jgi:hypothetical protein
MTKRDNGKMAGQLAGVLTNGWTRYRKLAILWLALLAAMPPAAYGVHSYPRVGNLFQGDVHMEYAQKFSKWDLVGFSATIEDIMPQMLTTVRSLNPNAKLLAYLPAAYIWSDYPATSPLAVDYGAKLSQEGWWLYDNRGNRIGQAGNLWYLNLTSKCSRDQSGEIFAQWLAHYIARRIMDTGYWHGVILDGVDEDIRWLNSCPIFFQQPPAGIDCNRDGVADNPDSLYAWWKAGVEIFLGTLRDDAGASCIILPNGNNYMYRFANGGIRENFPHLHGGWQENMFASYGYMANCANFLNQPINASMLLCYWREGAQDVLAPPRTDAFEQFMRYTLTSALLNDGYYFLDGGAAGSLWWHDYYDLDLGVPTGPAFLDTVVNRLGNLPCTIWRREFTNSTVYCNPSEKWISMEDGTFLWPEDGAVKVHSLPGPVAASIVRGTVDREFSSRQRSIVADVAVRNPSAKAAMAYIWVDVMRQGRTVIAGTAREHVIGAADVDTVRVGLGLPSSLDLGSYCLRVSVGGPDRVATGADTIYIFKVIDLDKEHRMIDDGGQHASRFEEHDLCLYPQPLLLSRDGSLTLKAAPTATQGEGTKCSVRIYDATGRLVDEAVQGRLEDGIVLPFGRCAKGGAPNAAGVYFLRIETRDQSITKKMVLLK